MKTIILTTIIFFFSIGVSNAQWQNASNGIFGGEINVIISDSNYIYAGTSNAGVFRSDDNGLNWLAINIGIEDQWITSMAIKGSSLYAGTRSTGIYRSNDFGLTWYAINVGVTSYNSIDYPTVQKIIVRDSNIYFSTHISIYKSNNGGNSWNSLFNINTINNNSITDFEISNNTIFYISSWTKFFISNNNGNSWVSPTGLDSAVYKVKKIGNYIYAHHQSGVYRTSDNGNIWSQYNFPFNSQIYNFENKLFAYEWDFDYNQQQNILKIKYSSDNGNTWSSVIKKTDFYSFSTLLFRNNELYIGTNKGIYVSTLNDTVFTYENNGIINNVGISDISIMGQTLFAVGNYRFFKSENLGNNWTEVNSNLSKFFYLYKIVNNGNVLFGTSYIHNYVIQSNDNGINWVPIINGLTNPSVETYDIAIKDSILYACSENGVFKYNLNDTTWIDISPSMGTYKFVNIIDSTIFTSGYSEMYYSKNKGVTWNKIDSVWNPHCCIKKDSIYIVTNYLGIYSSTDLVNWNPKNNGLSVVGWGCGVSSLSLIGNNIYASTKSGIYCSTDNGNSWYAVNSGLPACLPNNLNSANFIETDGTNVYASIIPKGIWKCQLYQLTSTFFQARNIIATSVTDSTFSINWAHDSLPKTCIFVKESDSGYAFPFNFNTFTPETVFGQGSQIDTSGWYCVYNGNSSNVSVTGLSPATTYRVMACSYEGSMGNEIYLTNSSFNNPINIQTTNNVGINNIQKKPIIFFPNPVYDNLFIKNITQKSMCSIYDINGKILISKEIDNSESINVSNFSKGIYIVKVQNKDEVITQKFIKE